MQSIGEGVGTHRGKVGLDEVKDGIVLSAEDDTLEVGLAPVIPATVLLEILLQSHRILTGSLPDATVADLEQQHAVTVLVEQIAVVGIVLHQLPGMIVHKGGIGNSINPVEDIILGSRGERNDSLGVDLRQKPHNRNRLLFSIEEHRHLVALDVLGDKGRVILAVGLKSLGQE